MEGGKKVPIRLVKGAIYRRTALQPEERILTKDRIMEYASLDGLTKMTGVEPENFDLYILKELIDNGLDACETYGMRPELHIVIEIKNNLLYLTVTDNGPGIQDQAIKEMTNFTRFSGTKYYVKKPTRGAQGNALMTILGIPGIVSYIEGKNVLEPIRIATKDYIYLLRIIIDKVMQKIEPQIEKSKSEPHDDNFGTSITVCLPLNPTFVQQEEMDSDEVNDETKKERMWGSYERYYDLVEGFYLWNPHAEFYFRFNNKDEARKGEYFRASSSKVNKFAHKGFGSPHWYKEEDFIELVHANIRANKERGKKETLINFAKRFKGCTGNRSELTEALTKGFPEKFIDDLTTDEKAKILFDNLKKVSKPLEIRVLGEIGKDHLRKVIDRYEIQDESLFKYAKIKSMDNGIPYVLEVAFGVVKKLEGRRVQFGINQTITYKLPFEQEQFEADLKKDDYQSVYSTYGIDGLLKSLHITEADPVFIAMHLTSPNIRYEDYGKSEVGLNSD